MIIQSASLPAIAWLVDKVKLPLSPELKGIQASTDDGKPVGVVLFDKWTHNAVRVHIAIEIPSRELAHAVFHHVFETCDKGILLAEIPTSISASLRLAQFFGFKEIYKIKDGWKVGVDLAVMELRREDWRAKGGL